MDSAFSEKLSYLIEQLEGGSLSIGQFNNWFANSRWESRMGPSSAGLRMGWSIQDALWQYEDFGDEVPASTFVELIALALAEYRAEHLITPVARLVLAEAQLPIETSQVSAGASPSVTVHPNRAESGLSGLLRDTVQTFFGESSRTATTRFTPQPAQVR